MKIKSGLYYLFDSSKKGIIIFYSILYSIFILLSILMSIEDEVTVSGLETNTMIALAIIALITLSEDYKFLSQNSFTRKSSYIVITIYYIGMAGLFALTDLIFFYVSNKLVNYESMFYMLYSSKNFILMFIWTFLLYLLVVTIIYFSNYIKNKIGNKLFFTILGGLAIILIIILPLVDVLFNINLSTMVNNIFKFVFGFRNNKINIIYPFIIFPLIISILLISTYFLNKKIEIK